MHINCQQNWAKTKEDSRKHQHCVRKESTY